MLYNNIFECLSYWCVPSWNIFVKVRLVAKLKLKWKSGNDFAQMYCAVSLLCPSIVNCRIRHFWARSELVNMSKTIISQMLSSVIHLYFPPSFHLTVGCSSTLTRHVENVVITTKGLQDRNNLLLDGRTVENKGSLLIWKFK